MREFDRNVDMLTKEVVSILAANGIVSYQEIYALLEAARTNLGIEYGIKRAMQAKKRDDG